MPKSEGQTPQEDPSPPVAGSEGGAAVWFREFLDTGMANPHTRSAYARAVDRFLIWCSDAGLRQIDEIEPGVVAAYLDQHRGSEATVRQHLAAIRMFFRALMGGGFIGANPASSVSAPHARRGRGRTPVLTPGEIRSFLEAIEDQTIVGLRDRAVVAVMVYAFARVGSVVALRHRDYFPHEERQWLRLRRWGVYHEIPLHRTAEAYLDAYLERTGSVGARRALFRTVNRHRALTDAPLTRTDVLRMVKRRARAFGFPPGISCHTFRASGITAYLENGGMLEQAQAIAGHKTARATRLYSPASDPITPADVDRIAI